MAQTRNGYVSHRQPSHAVMVVRGSKYAEVKRHVILPIYAEEFVDEVKYTHFRSAKCPLRRYFI
jgi:hypothetical protein